jgi:hypothetical protein
LWSLYIGAILLFLGILKFTIGMEAYGVVIGGAGLILLITASVIVLVRLFQVWRFLIGVSPSMGLKTSVLTPGCAVGYLFIPLFNLYWIFIALGRLPRDLNAMAHASDTQSRIPSKLGFAVAILSIVSIVPIAGKVAGVINGLILIPIFMTESVRLSREIASKMPVVGLTGKRTPVLQGISEIRNLPDLFDTKKYGIRFGAGLAFPVAKLAIMLLLALAFVPSVFPFQGEFLYFAAGQIIIGIFTGVLFVITCSTIRKTWLLPLVWGLAAVPIGFLTRYISIYFSLTAEQQERALSSFGFKALPISFLWGFLFMGVIILAVRFWGFRLWSFPAGLMIFYLFFNLPGWILHPQGLFHFNVLVFPFRIRPVVELAVLGILLYLGLRPSKGRETLLAKLTN